MRIKNKLGPVLIIFVVLMSTSLIPYGQDAEGKTDLKNELVRMDLLEKKVTPLEPPLRNIFKPDRRRSVSQEVQPMPPETEIERIRPGDQIEEINPLASMSIRYVGFTGSQEHIVALVLTNGQALAVKEGDMLSEFIRVLKITPSELEIEGEDSEIRKVLFEGEER